MQGRDALFIDTSMHHRNGSQSLGETRSPVNSSRANAAKYGTRCLVQTPVFLQRRGGLREITICRDINDPLFRSVRQGLYRIRDVAGASAQKIGEERLRVHPDGVG